MSAVHLIVPDWFDDPARPSGGSGYDRRVADGLAAAGWSVRVLKTTVDGPNPATEVMTALRRALAGIPEGEPVLVDGLIALAAPETFAATSTRLRVVVLVHMPADASVHGSAALQREGTVLAAAAATIATSRWTRTTLIARHGLAGGRVHVAEPGVDPADVASRSRDGGRLLCVAAVTPVKGHDVLVSALAAVSDRRWTCVVAGSLDRDPDFVREVGHQVEQAGLSERVLLAGALTGDQVDDAYASADLLLLPSRLESYGMVATEAIARGVPVIASRVGGLPDTLAAGPRGHRPGLLVPAGDPAALAAAVRRWLEDRDLRSRLRRAAVDRRRTLAGWGSTVDTIDRVLRRVAA